MAKQAKNPQAPKAEPVITEETKVEEVIVEETKAEETKVEVEKSYEVKGTFSMTGVNGVIFKEGDIAKESHLLHVEEHVKGGFLELVK